MKVRLWSVKTRTGEVVDEIKHATGTFVAENGGGECRLRVPVDHLTDRTGSAIDADAVTYVRGLLEPGARTILAVDDQRRCLGEWVIDKRMGATTDGTYDVIGVGWEILPSLKTQRSAVSYEDADQFTIARALLGAAFNHQDQIVTIPSGSSGVRRDLESPARTAYYGDLLDELAETDDGFEWAVDTTVQWAGEVPTSVTRHIVWGSPVLDRGPDAVIFDQDSPGSRRGSAVRISGGTRWTGTANEVTGTGGGDGGSTPRRTIPAASSGFEERLRLEKLVSFPGVLKTSHLDALIREELAASSSNAEQFSASGWADKLNFWPIVGQFAQLYANATWVFPQGIDLFVRIGRISWDLQEGGEVTTVDVVGVNGSDIENTGGET